MPDAGAFNDVHVFLTGATGGVGNVLLRQMITEGFRLFATAKTSSRLDAVASGLPTERLKVVAADLADTRVLKPLVNEGVEWLEGRIDVLINNAGIAYHSAVADIRDAELTEVIAVNAVAPILITSHALPALRRSPAPKVINISSILGAKPLALTAAYTASKHALNGFSKVLRLEEADAGICVTTIEPGAIETEFIARTNDDAAIRQFRSVPRPKISAQEVARWVMASLSAPAGVCPELIRVTPTLTPI